MKYIYAGTINWITTTTQVEFIVVHFIMCIMCRIANEDLYFFMLNLRYGDSYIYMCIASCTLSLTY